MTMPAPAHTIDPERLAWLNMTSCPSCGHRRIFGEPGWRCCASCRWDEMPHDITGGRHPVHDANDTHPKEDQTCPRP